MIIRRTKLLMVPKGGFFLSRNSLRKLRHTCGRRGVNPHSQVQGTGRVLRLTWPRIRGTTTVMKSCEKMEVKGTEDEEPSWRSRTNRKPVQSVGLIVTKRSTNRMEWHANNGCLYVCLEF